MKKRQNLLFNLILIPIFLFSMAGIGLAEVGVTDTTIKIGVIVDLAGPVAFMGKSVESGMKSLVSKINDGGGIHGRKIIPIFEDNSFSPPKHVAALKKIMERDKVFCFVGNLGTTTNSTTVMITEEAKIPVVAPIGAGTKMFKPPKRYMFCVYATQYYFGRTLVDFIANDLKGKDSRIGILYQDDETGRDALRGIEFQMKKYGMKLAAKEYHKRGALDLGIQVAKLKQAKCDIVISYPPMASPTAMFLTELGKIGWKPQVVIGPPPSDYKLIELAGKKNCEGVIASMCYPLLTENNAGVIEHKATMKKYNPKAKVSNYSFPGYISMKLAEVALRKTGRNLTREGLINTLESLKNYDMGPFPVTFGPKERLGQKKSFFNRIRNGEFIKLTDWRAPKD